MLKLYYHDNEGFIFTKQSERDKSLIYIIAVDEIDGWYCTCDDYKFRKRKCKHIRECEEYLHNFFYDEYLKYQSLNIFTKIYKK